LREEDFMACTLRISPRFLAAAVVTLAGAAGAPASHAGDAATEARGVIQSMWSSVVPILANKGLDKASREARFTAVYRANFDNAAIAAAVVGAPWQQASAPQRERFLGLFESYVVKVYTGQFATYKGEQLVVVKSEPEGDGAIVTTHIVDPAAPSARAIELKWRLRMTSNGLKVRDVMFENISMTLNQRREFGSVMQQRGGNLEGLMAALSEKIAQLATK
jgi:phospholipid transport system substrate-binding protein